MTLVDAKRDASARSLNSKRPAYIDLENNECKVVEKQTANSIHKFDKGMEVPLPKLAPLKPVKQAKASGEKSKPAIKKVKKPKNKKMKTSKKVTAKKSNVSRVAVKVGAKKELKVKDIIAKLKKGDVLVNKKGRKIPLKGMLNRADKDRVKVVYAAA